jgi:DNA-binding transcriptional ArsR family regulator
MSTAPALTPDNASELSRFLVALGDPTRQEILVSLARERLNVGELSARFSLSRPAVSHHLKVLSDAGVLKRERQGRERVYRVDAARCRELTKRLSGFVEGCCCGSACC